VSFSTLRSRPSLRAPSLTSLVVSRPDGWFDLLAVALAAVVAITVLRTPIGSGDYGQWLMVSRHYAGESVPDYRDLAAVPPLVPFLIALTTRFFSDPVLALTVVEALMAVGFVLATYWAGASLFDDRAAGLLGAACSFIVTDAMLQLFAFGGLPQTGALIFLAIAVGALARARRDDPGAQRWWIVGSVALVLTVFSHAGTGALAVLSVGSVALVSALGSDRDSLRERVVCLKPLAIGLAVLAPYWLFVIVPKNTNYLSNAASLNYGGPHALWQHLSADPMTLTILFAGAGILVLAAVYTFAGTRIGNFSVLTAWGAACWGFLAVSILGGVGTEYPRFVFPLLQPLAIAVGGGLVLAIRWLATSVPKRYFGQLEWAPVAVLALVLLTLGPHTAGAYRQESQGYRFPGLDSFVHDVAAIDAQLPEGQTILTTARPGKWAEGITGRAALFSQLNRYMFRDAERSRSLAADAILRSTYSASDGQYFLRYTSFFHDVPTSPWIAINHGGEYVDLLRFPSTEFEILSGDQVVATLSSLDAQTFKPSLDADVIDVATTFSGSAGGAPVAVDQQVVISKTTTTLSLLFDVRSDLPIDGLRLTLKPVAPNQVVTTLVPGGADLAFNQRGGSQPRLFLRTDTAGARVLEDGSLQVASDSHQLRVDLSFTPSAPPINDSVLLKPSDLVEQYDVGAVFLPGNPSIDARQDRLRALGFEYAGGTNDYVIMTRRSDP
jgi:hypothetical protein